MEEMVCQNLFYVFLPFQMAQNSSFLEGMEALEQSGVWGKKEIETGYMYRYISDKIKGAGDGKQKCFHYSLTPGGRETMNILSADNWYEFLVKPFEKSGYTGYQFQICDIQLYGFHTGMGLVVFELRARQSDPKYLSNLQFWLKNVSKCKFAPETAADIPGEEQEECTLLEMARSMLKVSVPGKKDVELGTFFVYANPGYERANVLTYVEVDKTRYEKRKEDLFFLKRCYGSSFESFEDSQREQEELYSSVRELTWGVTSEAAACVACLGEGNLRFLHKTFINNFKNQYLYMYVLLLHQKYVFYHFLTKISQGTYNDLKTLERYHVQLCDFETDYVFSRITDVPQYQQLYDKIGQAFSLRELYQDVKDPVTHLSELRQAVEEKEQNRRERTLSLALALLSLLAVFSGWADGFAFCEIFFAAWGEAAVETAKQICFGTVTLIGSVVLITVLNVLFPRKK